MILLVLPALAEAACPDNAVVCTFQQLPFLADAANLTTEDYINALYRMAISIAAILVVLRLVWAGVQYMLSEVVTSKEKARRDIQGALLGLLIVLGAVTILNTINPEITRTDILGRLEPSGGFSARQPIEPGTARCPAGQVWMECAQNGEVEAADCFPKEQTKWCTSEGGQIIIGGN